MERPEEGTAEHRIELGRWDGADQGYDGRFTRPADREIPIAIDASRLEFVMPMFMIRLHGFVTACQSEGREVSLDLPESDSVCNYLSRMHVGEGLNGCFSDLPSVQERDRDDVLIPVTRLHAPDDVERLGEKLLPLIREHDDDVAVFGNAIQSGVAELCGNGVEHGENEHGCFVAAQRFKGGREGPRTVLSIGDLGCGIPAKMRGVFPDLESDHEAVERAIELGVTSTGDQHRGIGFQDVIREAAESRMEFVNLEIRSGEGVLTHRVTRDQSSSVRATPGRRRAGTWINLVLGPRT